ncbi:MAG: nitrate- and nitrite sensing domain-containing protein, partial [Rhodospirillaceae bacterium]|nr:nitrate- and nitrite sensing domain-containing protein [Rhodospirillaceae bacterium]
MGFLQNTKIGSRILIALILPIVGLLFFSGSIVLERKSVSSEMDSIQELAELGPVISAVVHEMQKERGTSAVYIGSKGTKFSKELPQQRKDTDLKRVDLESALAQIDIASFGSAMVAKVDGANKALSELPTVRDQVASLSFNVPKMAGYYTPTIAKLLSVVEEMAVISTNAEITNQITAYTSFLQAKERSGVERAMGGAGFGAGQFSRGQYNNFVGLIAKQQDLLKIFNNYASQEQRDFYKNTVIGPDVDEVARMRKIAISSPDTGTTEGITGPYWFGTITKKIDLMKKVEDKIATDLISSASSIGGSAGNAFMLMLGITVVLLVITAIFVTAIIRGITGPIGAMTEAMTVLAGGNKEIEIEGSDRGDEIGSMASAVQVFKDNMIKADELTAQQEKENAAKEQRSIAMDKMAVEFEGSVTESLNKVATASNMMRSTADGMSTIADNTSTQSTAVAAAAEEASTNVQTVASASEELSSSISEISRQVSQSTQIASDAVDEVKGANEKVQGLAIAANKIGEV